MTNEAIFHAIVGQNEKIVFKRLGIPARIIQTPDDGKKLIYEIQSRGKVSTLNKSKLTFNYLRDMANQEQHL